MVIDSAERRDNIEIIDNAETWDNVESTDDAKVADNTEENNDGESTQDKLMRVLPNITFDLPFNRKVTRLSNRDIILTTTNSLAADKKKQEVKLVLAKLSRWTSVGF